VAHPNVELLDRFYGAFARRDGDAMAACYAPGATFSDPVFPRLSGTEAGDMWRMLTGRSTDLRIDLEERAAGDDTGTAHWIAHYTFNQTGRFVENDIRASFRFADGLITEHRDVFDFYRWARQALGPVGLLAGWSPPLRAAVRRQARASLEQFRARSPER
jgi:ketosteroid isomerase-like protein